MKIQFALFALLLTLPSFAHAASKQACAFGENTADLQDLLDQKVRNKEFYRGEHLSIHNMQRLQGLSSAEKKMILLAQGQTAAKNDSDKELLESFVNGEGYISYFTQNSSNREFASVASFPGDNEFGVIVEIQSLKRKGEYKILTVVAVIGDGDLEDCTVTK